ncbi:MAG: hypothetical protein J0H49_19555 [Acidobacteria bacterium]|nr:hypothetical protein [Acidobacteriota bacterium]
MSQVAQVLGPIIGFAYLCLLAFLIWRFYIMTRDVADMKRLLQSLVDEQKKKGATPLPEQRPDSLEN